MGKKKKKKGQKTKRLDFKRSGDVHRSVKIDVSGKVILSICMISTESNFKLVATI